MKEQSVISLANGTQNGKMLDGEKEQTRVYKVVAYDKARDQFKEPVTVRCWMSRSRTASVVYASIWAFGSRAVNVGGAWTREDIHVAGHGRAGGYGYDRHSAAIGAAIRSAGIKLDKDISGVGESAVREALLAITGECLIGDGYAITIVEG